MTSNPKEAQQKYRRALALAKEKSPDLKRVSTLLLEAKKLGSPDATYALATWYLHGEYFDLDLKKGTSLLVSAAKKGVVEACYDLAINYEKGIVVSKDLTKAHELYMESALNGDEDACYAMYRLYWHGIGVKKNRKLAELWYPGTTALKKARRSSKAS